MYSITRYIYSCQAKNVDCRFQYETSRIDYTQLIVIIERPTISRNKKKTKGRTIKSSIVNTERVFQVISWPTQITNYYYPY